MALLIRSYAWLCAWLNTDVPSWAGYVLASFVTGLGLAAPIAGWLAVGEVPDSFFGAATYLGVTGVAVATRSHSRTSQDYRRSDFIRRVIAGALIVGFAVYIEVYCNKPDLASWVVYALAVLAELGFWWSDARRPAPAPAPMSTSISRPRLAITSSVAFLSPVAVVGLVWIVNRA